MADWWYDDSPPVGPSEHEPEWNTYNLTADVTSLRYIQINDPITGINKAYEVKTWIVKPVPPRDKIQGAGDLLEINGLKMGTILESEVIMEMMGGSRVEYKYIEGIFPGVQFHNPGSNGPGAQQFVEYMRGRMGL